MEKRERPLGAVLRELDGAVHIGNLGGSGAAADEAGNVHLKLNAEVQACKDARVSWGIMHELKKHTWTSSIRVKSRVPTSIIPVHP